MVAADPIRLPAKWLTLEEASRVSGHSIENLLRGAERGHIAGRQFQTRHGIEWRVLWHRDVALPSEQQRQAQAAERDVSGFIVFLIGLATGAGLMALAFWSV
jgi:hypothetical protein